jgi:hypothetical protein
MSLSSDGIHDPRPVVADLPRPDRGDAALDLRATSTSRLLVVANQLLEAICSASIFEPEVPDLIRREYAIRQELGRRDVLMMQSVVWATTEPPDTAPSPPPPMRLNRVKTRNGRGGPGGPGDWDD